MLNRELQSPDGQSANTGKNYESPLQVNARIFKYEPPTTEVTGVLGLIVKATCANRGGMEMINHLHSSSYFKLLCFFY